MNKNNITITMLKTLVSLRETGSISRTAEQLHVTQSAISHTVRALESVIGIPVLIREPRGVVLTAAGDKACHSADTALKSIHEILQLANNPISGEIKVATVVSASRTIIPEVLTHLRRSYPDIEVQLLIGTDTEVEQWVASGIAEIGLAYNLEPKNSESLIQDQFYVISEQRSSHTPNIPLSSLDGQTFIMSSAGCEEDIQAIFNNSGVNLNIKMTVSDMNAIFAIVGAGYGISIVPGLAFPDNWSQLVLRQSMTPKMACSLDLIIAQEQKTDPCVQVVSDTIKQISETIRLNGEFC